MPTSGLRHPLESQTFWLQPAFLRCSVVTLSWLQSCPYRVVTFSWLHSCPFYYWTLLFLPHLTEEGQRGQGLRTDRF